MVESRDESGIIFTVGWKVCGCIHRATKYMPLGSITTSLERSIGGSAVLGIGGGDIASIGDEGVIASIGGGVVASIGDGGAIASIGDGGAVASFGGGGAIASLGGGAIASLGGGVIASFGDESEVDESLAPCGLPIAGKLSPSEKKLKKKKERAAASRAWAEEMWPGDFCKFF